MFALTNPYYMRYMYIVVLVFICLKMVKLQISPRKKLFRCVSPRYTPCAKYFFAEKNKSHLFRRRAYFVETLRESSRRNFAKVRGGTLRDFAKTLREIWRSRWVGFLHADNEVADQMEKLSECPA